MRQNGRTPRTRTWTALLGLAAACGLALFACSPNPGSAADVSAADAIFYNGKIVTANESFDVVSSVAVRNGRFIAVGSDRDVERFAGARTERIDLGGQTVLPGFFDNHVHVNARANDPTYLSLEHIRDLEDLQEALRARAAELDAGEWITGSIPTGRGIEPFTEATLPTRHDLDEAAPDHPVSLGRGHIMIVNSAALERAGIDRNTPQPDGGRIDLDERGEPNGILRETPARRIVRAVLPDPDPMTEEHAYASIRERLDYQLSLGVTSLNVPGVLARSNMPRWLQSVYDESGAELPRMTLQIRLSPGFDTYDDPAEGIAAAIAELEGLEFRTGIGDDRFRLGAIKMSIDGGYTGQSAWQLEHYHGQPDFHGTVRIPEETLYPVARRAHELGWQLGIHAIGDAAVVLAVDVIDRILEEHPREDHRHYLHHISTLPPEETLRTISERGIIAAMQPNFTWSLANYYSAAKTGDRLDTNNPLSSLVDQGIDLSFGSDNYPDGPLYGIYAAVNRMGVDGRVYGPGERISVEDAIRYYTAGTAYMTFNEDVVGTIEPGKYADMVVLDRDILTVDPEEIKDIEVDLTIVGGEVVYSRAD